MRPRLARPYLLAAVTIPLLLTACSDESRELTRPIVPSEPAMESSRGAFVRYVAIGTSVSMGWESDGVVGASQRTSWPAQLAELAGRPMTVPAIEAFGCGARIAAPLAGGTREGGEGIGQPLDSRTCSLNESGVVLPANNVAITAATAADALGRTPDVVKDQYDRLYGRVLAPGQSQVTAMMAQNPKVVTIELGANEVLGARNGVFLPGVTVVPVAYFEATYLKVLDSAAKVAKHVALVGLIDHAVSFPSFRTGHEIWQARATLVPFNVAVAADCENSANVVFVAARIPDAAARGAASARAGTGPHSFSCHNYESSTRIQDYVLGPADIQALDAQLAQMDAIIAREAARRGWAHVRLASLYEDVNVKEPFNAITLMTSAQPYGPFISLDGFHPSATGSRIIAGAAARAFNDRYGFAITESGGLFAGY